MSDDFDDFTALQKMEAAEREVKQRMRVYPRLISQGKMTREQATYQTDIMRAIARDYFQLSVKERLL
jgi:hypothetical protein